MKDEELWEMFKETGAWDTGHFLLTTGRHSSEFFLLSRLFQYPRYAEICGKALAEKLAAALQGREAKSVVGPAMGGVLVAHEVASNLGLRSMFAEYDDRGEEMALRRGFMLEAGEPVIVVEDAVTTGTSARRAAQAVIRAGGRPVLYGAVVDRSGGKVQFDAPFVPLLRTEIPDYAPEACPLCAEGVPLRKPKQR